MAHLDRHRAQTLLTEAGLDALVLLSPEGFSYATGASPGVGAMWRRAGAFGVLVPADAGTAEAAVVSDLFVAGFRHASHIKDARESPLWVETATALPEESDIDAVIDAGWTVRRRQPGFSRPATFDAALCWRHLADALAERVAGAARVGVEMTAISAADWPAFEAALGRYRLADASEVVARLRMVKSPGEIALLRQAVELAETGIAAVRAAAGVGVSRDDLSAAWKRAVEAHRGDAPLSGAWDYIAVGEDPWGGNAVARPGDLVKVDVGCLMRGYSSDTGRTFAVGPPSDAKRRVFDALMAGFRKGSELLRPGVPLAAVHHAAQTAIRAAGFPGFDRGHYGHSLGTGPGNEEWPFISRDSTVAAEAGMVLAFECPWYIDGLGGFIIEDQFLISETGAESMNRLPLGLETIT